MSSDNFLRQSQVVTSFGPGALVDLPDHSVIICGLDDWRDAKRQPVPERRLEAKLAALTGLADVKLYAPPPFSEDDERPASIAGRIFPTWFTTRETVAGGGGVHGRRRLVGHSLLSKGNIYEDPEETDRKRKRKHAVPMRFVCGCVRGHIDDIDWRWYAHRGSSECRRTLWVEERGSTGDVADFVVGCDCGKERRLHEARAKGTLGTCRGKRPWLGDFARESCTEKNQLLLRSAVHAYYPETLSALSLPDGDERLKDMVARHWTALQKVDSAAKLPIFRDFNPDAAADLEGFEDHAIIAAIDRHRSGGSSAIEPGGVRPAEFRLLASGKRPNGDPGPDSTFFAEDLDRAVWDPDADPMLHGITRVVAVHRLREVTAQVGFTRFEAAGMDITGDLDVATQRAALTISPSWFPAVENRGEGVFVQLRAEAVSEWMTREAVAKRIERLDAGFNLWRSPRPGSQRRFPGGDYIMVHSFAHLLLTAVALDCGYPASALRERVYGFDGMYGVLILTATSGSEGTLGGLAAASTRIGGLIRRAVESARLCSNDPVCAHHAPDDPLANRHLHGAACHGCMLIAETSCEQRNDLLDRALVVDSMAVSGTGFFGAP